MAFYKEFQLDALSASTSTAAFKLHENTSLGLQCTVVDPATFDADVFLEVSLKREEPGADTDWFVLMQSGASPGDPMLTLTTAGSYGETGLGAVAKWGRVRVTVNTGDADVTIRVLGLGGNR